MSRSFQPQPIDLAKLRAEIAGSDSGRSTLLDTLPDGTPIAIEIEAVLGTSRGGYQPLTVQRLVVGDLTWWYLTHGYAEGYRAEIFDSLDELAAAIPEPALSADERAVLAADWYEIRKQYRRAVAEIIAGRQHAIDPNPHLAYQRTDYDRGPLTYLEVQYARALLRCAATRSLLADLEAEVRS